MYNNNSQKGSAIYFAVIVTTILVGIAFGLSTLLLGGIDALQGSGRSILAFHAAEAGAERILFEDQTCVGDPVCLQSAAASWSASSKQFSNGAHYDVVVVANGSSFPNGTVCNGDSYCAQSTGMFQDVSRRIEIER